MTNAPDPTVRRTTRNAPKPAPPQRARIYVPVTPPGIDDELRAIGAITIALRSVTSEGRIEVLMFILRRFGIKWTDLSR